METLEKNKQEGLVEYADRLSELYTKNYSVRVRKPKGQFFTPKQISRYMVNLLDVNINKIRLLDPGAGTGMLTSAFCERLLSSDKVIDLTIDAYEYDPNLSQMLKNTLEACKTDLEAKGHKVQYNVYESDFILNNNGHFYDCDSLWGSNENILYDFVISNPPYYKLNKNDPQSIAMMQLNSGQPNIYTLFMALATSLLRINGEMVFITPRSFCSGLYYKKFREWFINNVHIENIHIFESRDKIFDRDCVLQENVIVKSIKSNKVISQNHDNLTINISEDKDFNKIRKIDVKTSDLISYSNGENFIRIPTSHISIDVINIIDSWTDTLVRLGFEVSTGPVVPFRAEQYLLYESSETMQSVPLLWMHNMQNMGVVWPLKKNRKPYAIRVCDKTIPLLIPVRNYVLVNRFSSKEQKRRLYASVFLESHFGNSKVIGIENHVNYIRKPGGNLTIYEAFGIAGILNTKIIDIYFRSLNGNTQVNAIDIRSLPFPNIDDIKKIGYAIYDSRIHGNILDIDDFVAEMFEIDPEIIRRLKREHYE